MSKLHWSLTTVLLITPLAASCSRQSSEPQAMRDDTPAVVTQTVVLDDLIAKSRQIERSHQTRQQLHDDQQQSQVVAVAYPSPERKPSNWRSLVDDQMMDQLQQQIRQARRRVTNGFRLAATRASSAMNRLKTVAIYAYENASPADEQPAEEQPADEQPAEEQPAEEQPAEEQPAEQEPVDAVQLEDLEQDPAQDEPLSEDEPPVEPEIEVSPSDAVAAVQKLPPVQTVRSVRACRTPRRLLRASTPRLGRRIARLRQNVPPCPAPTIVVVRPVAPVVHPAARRTLLTRCSAPTPRRMPIRHALRRR